MKMFDVLVNGKIVKADAMELKTLKKFSAVKKVVKDIDCTDNISIADKIEVSHKFKNREEAMNIISKVSSIGVKLSLVSINPLAMIAFNNMVEERKRQFGGITEKEEVRIASLVERIYGTNIIKTTSTTDITTVMSELNRTDVDWVLYGKVEYKNNCNYKVNNLKNILIDHEIGVESASYMLDVYEVTV